MAEIVLSDSPISVSQVDGSPNGCSLCQSVEGPFVIVGQASFNMQTPEGPVVVDQPLVLCAPRIERGEVLRQGCVGQMALAAGFLEPGPLEQAEAANRLLREALTISGEEIAALKASQVKVVPVSELVGLLDGAAA